MYAIVETGGKQYRVKPGDTVAVEKLTGEPGEMLDLDRVLLIAGNGDSEPQIGSPRGARAGGRGPGSPAWSCAPRCSRISEARRSSSFATSPRCAIAARPATASR